MMINTINMKKMAASVYSKDRIIPRIIEVLKKDNINITPEHIKIWDMPMMSMTDIVRGCNFVKDKLNSNVIIYTNIVPNREYLEKNEDIKIVDELVLKELALKYRDYELYDMLR